MSIVMGGIRHRLIDFSVFNGAYRADILAQHTGNIARPVDGNGVERTNKWFGLRTDRHAGTTVNAGIPAYIE